LFYFLLIIQHFSMNRIKYKNCVLQNLKSENICFEILF
jgi:hypothetical protein